MSKKKQKFAMQKKQLICPACKEPTRRVESRLTRVNKGYTVHGVTSYHYGHLCKACAESQQDKGRFGNNRYPRLQQQHGGR